MFSDGSVHHFHVSGAAEEEVVGIVPGLHPRAVDTSRGNPGRTFFWDSPLFF